MRLDSRLNIKIPIQAALLIAASITCASAQNLPDGPGKEETTRVCKGCHELARSVSLKQDREGWAATMRKMIALGAKGSEKDFNAVFEYLVRNYPADAVVPLNVNEATQVELESRLSLRRSQAAAVVRYRNENGPFKSIDDLKKVPGIDANAIEARKSSLVF